MTDQPQINLSPKGWDEIKTTTCYMCACRCGIKVHLKDGKVVYIDGNRDHPVNKGIICGKGASGIKQHYSPARLTKPLIRVGERGKGEFKEIEWEEALRTATLWLSETRSKDPSKLAFFTGRDQSQGLTGWWASQYGTPNYAAHGGFCSVNMAAAGLYTYGGAFWEFGEPDWKYTKYFLLFGVAEDHGSNPIKAGLGKLKARGAKIVSINPVKTGYSAIADEWVGIKPGTDGLFVGALIHCLLAAQKIDGEYLSRYTNAPWLVIEHPGEADDGLILRNGAGTALVWDASAGHTKVAGTFGTTPSLLGRFTLPDGRKVVTSFTLIAERFTGADYAPETVEAQCGVPAATTRRIAAELAHTAFEDTIELDHPWTDYLGRRHEKTIGRPVSMHGMRGISAHSNGFHTCRTIHILQIILGTIDVPGGSRYKPPFPKAIPPNVKPSGKPGQVKPNTPLPGPPLGFVNAPEDLLVDEHGTPLRIDKAYSWDAPLSAHGMMHMVINNAGKGDPYGIDVLFMYMANMSWNSAMNVPDTITALTAKQPNGDYVIPKIIYSDAYQSEMVHYADLILPDTTYLERYDAISMLDRPISEADGPADAIRHPVVQPDRDVRAFQTVLLDLGYRLGLPAMTTADGNPRYPGGYPDYIVNHERAPGLGPLAGFRGKDGTAAGRGQVNPNQLEDYKANGSFWFQELADNMKYYRHVNWDYLDWATFFGFLPRPEPIIHQLYSETMQKFRLAARGLGKVSVPDQHKARIETYFDPIPFWYAPFEGEMVSGDAFPLHAITQRPMAMYHSWGSQNAWLRQILGRNWLYMHKAKAAQLGIADQDWVDVTSHHNTIKVQVKLVDGQNEDTVWTWNAIGKRKGAWALSPDSHEAEKGFLLNHLISDLLPEKEGGYRYSNSDPVTGQAAWFDLKVRITKSADQKPQSAPQFPVLKMRRKP
ncbi:MAG: molybdopterin oxidoreductase family protein [Alphaproteobacteria bacterium]|nr:molybdopterin oxidoreductase family protein [Alphaproteobacteria bacterium]